MRNKTNLKFHLSFLYFYMAHELLFATIQIATSQIRTEVHQIFGEITSRSSQDFSHNIKRCKNYEGQLMKLIGQLDAIETSEMDCRRKRKTHVTFST
jgi:hypothetical protein